LSRLEDGQETFSPVFPNSPARPSMFSASQRFERPPLYSVDEFGKVSLQPKGSDWVFSASIQYGRSISKRNVHQQTYSEPFIESKYQSGYLHQYSFPPKAAKFADTNAKLSQSHAILDFQAGKDVGLGLFGNTGGSSVFSIGVRFAQFTSKTNIAIKSDPDWHRLYKYLNYPSFGITNVKREKAQAYHSNGANLNATRSFHGVGPSLSWNASTPFAGDLESGELTVDWGVNAALLFGRQRAKTHHQTTGRYSYRSAKYNVTGQITHQAPNQPDHTRTRNVLVPNVGGFAGLSFKYNPAKLSLGYRADFFFGALDGGIDARKSETVGFYGPFASVSIGLGD